jgi:helix-turn-helix protein
MGERKYHQPSLCGFPAIKDFLGYGPDELPDNAPLGRRIAARRRALGLSQVKLAKLLGINETTVADWERCLLRKQRGDCGGCLKRWRSDAVR